MRNKSSSSGLSKVIGWYRGTLLCLFLVSGVINLLALTGSFYMLQIYDRALGSQSVETLIGLSVLAIGLYVFQGLLDVTRTQILIRMGARIDHVLAPMAHRVTIDMPRFGYSAAEANERGRDVDVLRQFISGQGPIALLDLPWMPLYLVFVYLLHPLLALLVLVGAVVLGTLTLITELKTRALSSDTQKAAILRSSLSDTHIRNVDVLRAMGITGRSVARFESANREHLSLQMQSSDISGTYSGISKVLRMILQSAVLGFGAYLVIRGELSAGSIIAASVASARALSPIDMVIGQWKGFVAARRSYHRLGDTVSAIDAAKPLVDLPPPTDSLKVEKITVAAPGSGTVVLNDVSFEMQAGQALGLIGQSGSGKSSFARAITGVWPLVRGSVRLDNAELNQWDSDVLGSHLGYLPQDVLLLDGTVSENICRFDTGAESKDIIAAAKQAGVHEMILRMDKGYETKLGANGTALSAGQRQRVALARAVYGSPFLVILDEPNSNLDSDGEAALTQAIRSLRKSGSIVIVIAHRPSALAACDLVGVMQAGKLIAFGPKDEVLAKQVKPVPSTKTPMVASADGGEARWASNRI
jgi:PrtD family type I secretion system ABC transporter